MADLCRLCAAVYKKEMLDTITINMCQKLSECLGIEICQPGDELPKRACKRCATRLQDTYEFFHRIKESQESLNLLYGVSNDSSTDETNRLNKNQFSIIDRVSDVAVETSDQEIILSDTADFVLEGNVAAQNENSDEVNCELYRVMKSDEDNLIESFIIQNESNNGEELLSEQDDDNEVIETHIFKDDGETLLESYQNYEEYEGTDIGMPDNSETAVIQIIPQSQTATKDPQLNQTTTSDILQILKWKNYSWLCHSCSENCASFIALRQHVQEKHDTINYTSLQYECADCHKMSANYHKFINHVRFRHHTALRLRCDVCDIPQDNYTQLAYHRQSMCSDVAELYPLVDLCKICGKGFHDSHATSMHARLQHNNGEKNKSILHSCSQCKKQFKRTSILRAHEKLHSGPKEFVCEICDRKFRHKNNLDTHFYTHINDKVFKCKVCMKSYKTPVSLEKHQLIHKDIKEFTCDHCDKKFRTKDQKDSHERIHTGEKPYKCTVCGRAYRFRSGLMSHVSMHTGQLPYSCQNCDRRFSNWSNMNKHLKRCKSRKDKGGELDA
ncbi:zinc finger protein 723-like isoform X2 [Eurosta solidaginis]|uniref:zinc finger protein 723-like isoform X2 n=1 Tax=Eurosta solidaginis TaxID=178769 RepID=UPI0035308BC8